MYVILPERLASLENAQTSIDDVEVFSVCLRNRNRTPGSSCCVVGYARCSLAVRRIPATKTTTPTRAAVPANPKARLTVLLRLSFSFVSRKHDSGF
jgi:hypothetical protein